MPYVKAVIKEALRLYPVAPFLTRILEQDISLNGYNVPAGVSSSRCSQLLCLRRAQKGVEVSSAISLWFFLCSVFRHFEQLEVSSSVNALSLCSLRQCRLPDEYYISPQKLILMSLYTTGRDPKSFPEPDSFKPERWLRENRADSKVDSWACLPFGLGSRSCIGRRIAEVQMQFLLARTVQQFQLELGTEGEVPIRMRLITTPENPISLKLTPRV